MLLASKLYNLFSQICNQYFWLVKPIQRVRGIDPNRTEQTALETRLFLTRFHGNSLGFNGNSRGFQYLINITLLLHIQFFCTTNANILMV